MDGPSSLFSATGRPSSEKADKIICKSAEHPSLFAVMIK